MSDAARRAICEIIFYRSVSETDLGGGDHRNTTHLRVVWHSEVEQVEPALSPGGDDRPRAPWRCHGAYELRIEDVPPRALLTVVPTRCKTNIPDVVGRVSLRVRR